MKKKVISQINTTDTSRMTEFDLTGDPTTYGAFTKKYNPNYQFVKNTTPIAEPTIPKKTFQDFQRIYVGIDNAIKNNDKLSLQKWNEIYQKERSDFDPDKQNQLDTLLKRQSNNTSVLQQVNVDALGDKFETIGRLPVTPENKTKLISLKDEYLQKRNTFTPQQIKFVDEELRTAYDNFKILNELPQLPPVQTNTTQLPISAPQQPNPVTQAQPQNTAPQSSTPQIQNTPTQSAQNTPFDYKTTIENLKNLVTTNRIQEADNLINSILPKIDQRQAEALKLQYLSIRNIAGNQNYNKAAYDMANNIVGSLVQQYPNYKTDLNSQNSIRQRLNNYRPPTNMANLSNFINNYANQIFNNMVGQQPTANSQLYNNFRYAQKIPSKQLMDQFLSLNMSNNPREFERLKQTYIQNVNSYTPQEQVGINNLISVGDKRYNSQVPITPTPEAKQYLRDQIVAPRPQTKSPINKINAPRTPQQAIQPQQTTQQVTQQEAQQVLQQAQQLGAQPLDRLPSSSVQFQNIQSLVPTSRTIVDPNAPKVAPPVFNAAKATPGDISTLATYEENITQATAGTINYNQAIQQAKKFIFQKNMPEAMKISEQINRSNLQQATKDAFNQQYARLVQTANSPTFNAQAYEFANNLVANLIAANKTYKTDPKVQQLIRNRINGYKLPANSKLPLQTVIQNANQIFSSIVAQSQVKKAFNYNNTKNNKKG